ncbi:MAG: hypothetical protein JKY46_04515 [Robiginitomaculum sp.]|nr:hypothetical protein [Robiginitomaculum sp.]
MSGAWLHTNLGGGTKGRDGCFVDDAFICHADKRSLVGVASSRAAFGLHLTNFDMRRHG